MLRKINLTETFSFLFIQIFQRNIFSDHLVILMKISTMILPLIFKFNVQVF